MDPYAKPNERKVGAHRPKIRHLPQVTEPRTRRERQAEKEVVAAERRAIKKSSTPASETAIARGTVRK
jgi:hypothetical protein